jgi:UDP-glucose 4-epimerase
MPYTIVTGSSGFIGQHLCARLRSRSVADAFSGIDMERPAAPTAYRHIDADIRRPDHLRAVAAALPAPGAIFHLAAAAEVLTPWSVLPPLLSSNVEGTYYVLDCLQPKLVVFASSSSVYGNAGLKPVDTRQGAVRPLSLYAISKQAGEMILRDWAHEMGRPALIFRFGNVIGPGCRGLIPYLAGHILRHPEGGVPARLRGMGRLVRDYVPVDYVVSVLLAAVDREWPQQSVITMNLATGRAMTNREVAEIVQQVAAMQGFALNVAFDDPPGAGEADEVVLDMEETVKLLGLDPPDADKVRESIAEAVVDHLCRARLTQVAGVHA